MEDTAMGQPDHLDLSDLDDDDRAEIFDIAERMRARKRGGDPLAVVLADPTRKAELKASLAESRQRAARGESLTEAAVFDELLADLPE